MNEDEPPDSRGIKSLTERIEFLEKQVRCRERVLEVTQQTDDKQFDFWDKIWMLAGNENVISVDAAARPTYGYNEEEYFFQVKLKGILDEEGIKRFLAQNKFPERPIRCEKNGETAYVYRLHDIEVRFYQSTS